MEEGDVKVRVIGQQTEDAIALASTGNIEEGMQCKLMFEVGKTSVTLNVSRIEIELQRTIDIVEDQEIVALQQKNVNVDPYVQIDGGEMLYLTYYN